MKKRHLVTAALPYANGSLHIGHLAGCYIPADIYVRFLRKNNKDVIFIGGSDEHGVPITIRAMKENTTPQHIIDKYHFEIKKNLEDFGISFDIYSRTSSIIHHKNSQDFFLNLYYKGLFEEKETEQFYDEERKTFLADRYITGTCPHCKNTDAYGDQCEKCGSSLSPDELINPKSMLSNSVPIKKKTTHWFFPLQHYESFLAEWLSTHKDWKPNVYGQCQSWLNTGLHSRAMTRDSNWGVKVPLKNADGKVLYVWFDAPIGYISATQELTKDWKKYWCDEESELVHFIGKDNIVFHCVIFPAMLKAHGDFILPTNVPANEFLNIQSNKISTSKNWAVWLNDFLNDFPNQQDLLRYVLISILPETKDSDFTWKDFQDRINNELVAIFGNFINRAFVLMHKLCNSKVPKYHYDIEDEFDKSLQQNIADYKIKIENNIAQFKFRDALFEIIDLARQGNKYMQDKAPWILAKHIVDDPSAQQKIDNCLYLCLQLSANLAIFIYPFLPFTAQRMCKMMKVVDKMLDWENIGKINLLKTGYSLNPPELLFNKIEDEQIEKQIAKMQQNESVKTDTDIRIAKEYIGADVFDKIELRVGQILKAEAVEKSDKLLKFEVDLGFEKRIILSGIAQQFKPTDLIYKKVVVVCNLAPRKMRGIESNGMILLATDQNNKMFFVEPVDAPNGSEVR